MGDDSLISEKYLTSSKYILNQAATKNNSVQPSLDFLHLSENTLC